MKCFYHSSDLDGHCSGAIIKYFYPECKLYPINYGKDFPWDEINYDEMVFMVDFGLQPFEDMIKLNERCNLIWIDHHSTAIDDYEKSNIAIGGIRRIGIGACYLTWEYLSHKNVPYSVKMLAEYDVWIHDDKYTLPFQYGMKLKNTWPGNNNENFWESLFKDDSIIIEKLVEDGKIIMEYEEQTNIKFCKLYVFETLMLESPFSSFHTLKAICINKGVANSKIFDSVWDPKKYDVMITFCRLPYPKKLWTVSLYSDKSDINCGIIAKSFGGGGHKGAAGFQCKNLPFEI